MHWTHVDMLKLTDLYKPVVTKPNIAEPVTVPATPRMRNVIKTMMANVTLVPLALGVSGVGSMAPLMLKPSLKVNMLNRGFGRTRGVGRIIPKGIQFAKQEDRGIKD
jgi:hypothetical protein